ncbi:MAG: thioredoxin-dependent thiol peroxidase [Actinobacteria bacterium]|jgi:peroxiredoxin Q/BCP|nr:thioredoxin-dependent thiol peroxidase [Actinomycetota bacterium]
MLEAGQPAPDFTLPDQDGNPVSLSDFGGRPVVVYFYPKDDTPGCTTQACDIRDQWGEFEAAGAAVVGISPDSVESHAKFRGKHDLPHILLADPDRTVMEPWGAYGEKTLYGKKTVGVIRSTVLVDADGNVAKVWKRVQAKKHADQVLKALADL